MGRRSTVRQLDVWMNGLLAGHWKISAQGAHEFAYAETWITSPLARPISLSMPLRNPEAPYRGAQVEAFFDCLLPDNPDLRRRAQRRFAAPSTDAFDLLAEIGRDCIGALQTLPPDQPPFGIRKIQGNPLSDEAVGEILRGLAAGTALGQPDGEDFRISLAGAQEKTALLWHDGRWRLPRGSTPTTHIFKLPLGKVGAMQADLSASVENEWLCAQIIRAFGIPIASSRIATFQDQKSLIVERFDRRLSPDRSWWLRLPQEDMCQAMAVPRGLKYEAEGGPGISEISAFLLGAREAQSDRRMFFQSQVLFWMLCAIDGHARNFSVFIERGGRFSLTPLYDVISAYPILGHGKNRLAPEKARMAMAARGSRKRYPWSRITRDHWRETARACGLGSEADGLISTLVEATPSVVEKISSALPKNFPDSIAGPILKGLSRSLDLMGS